ncbi:MAG: ThuA domain-containing protein [Sedimentisphaeraceae bacterium JB056]
MSISMKKYIVFLVFLAASLCNAVSDKEKETIRQAVNFEPQAAVEAPRSVLVFDLCNGYRHSSIPYWNEALQIMGQKTGVLEAEISSDMNIFNDAGLSKFDVICFNNTTKLTFDEAQKKALLKFVNSGKGVVGIHAAVDSFYDFPEAAQMMGSIFNGHPWTADGVWTVKIDDPDNPLVKSFNGLSFNVKDEIYRTSNSHYSRDKLRVLMSLDMNDPATAGVKDLQDDDMDTGISWIRKYGKGRVFYCSLGHNNELCWNSPLLAHMLAGLQYAAGDLEADDTPSTEKSGIGLLVDVLKDYDWNKGREPLIPLNAYIDGKVAAHDTEDIEEIFVQLLSENELTFAARDYICRKLSVFGSDISVPALLNMLEDDEAADIALYALRQNDTEIVNQKLVEILPKLDYAQMGVINMLGKRKYAGAAEAVSGIMNGSSDSSLIYASVNSLGEIGTEEALEKLVSFEGYVSDEMSNVYCNALIGCAENIEKANKLAAVNTYSMILASEAADNFKYAALKGMISCKNDPMIVFDKLNSGEFAFYNMLNLLRNGSGKKFTDAVLSRYAQFSDSKRIKVLKALSDSRNLFALDMIKNLAKEAPKPESIEAIRAMKQIYDKDCVLILISKIAQADVDIAEASRDTLYSLSGEEIDSEIISLLDSESGESLIELVRACGGRYINDATAKLIQFTFSDDRKVKREAFNALELAADTSYITQFTDMLLNTDSSSEKRYLERILINLVNKSDDKAAEVNGLEEQWVKTEDVKNKKHILNILGSVGLDSSVEVFEMALSGDDLDMQYAAIDALSKWPTDKPKEKLFEYAKKSPDKKKRILSLRGFIKLIGLPSDRPNDETAELYFKAMELAETVQEKRMIFSGLSSTKSPKAFLMVSEYIDDPQLKAEAEVAAVKLGWWVRWDVDKDKMKEIIGKIRDNTRNEGLKAEAGHLYTEL